MTLSQKISRSVALMRLWRVSIWCALDARGRTPHALVDLPTIQGSCSRSPSLETFTGSDPAEGWSWKPIATWSASGCCDNCDPRSRPWLISETITPKLFKLSSERLAFVAGSLDLFGAELLAINGSQFKAVNNQHTNFTQAKLEKALKAIDAKVEPYLRALDAADREESSVQQPTREERQNKIARRKARQQRYRGVVEAITASGETQLSLTDPESRAMPQSPKGDGGDNVQMAVASQHQRIVEQDVTKAITADDQLGPLAMRATETLRVDQRRAVADMGSSHGHEINACDEAGMEAYVSQPSTSANPKHGRFGKERFTDAPETDGYRCPAGAERTLRCETTELGRHLHS